MKFCNYCGNPVTEPSRFCPMCESRLPFEVFDDTIHTVPISFQSFTAREPERTPTEPIRIPFEPESISLLARIKSRDKWEMMIVAFIAFAIILTGLNHTQAAGIEGSWTATGNLSEMTSMMGDHAVAIIKHFFTPETDQVAVSVDLNKDNTMSFITTLGDDSLGAETTKTGTYEVLSDDTISLNVNETTTSFSLFGQSSKVEDYTDETLEFTYNLDGNQLTLSNNGMELQLDRS